MKAVVQPDTYTAKVMHNFRAWAEKIGLLLEYRLLLPTQLGMVCTRGLSFLGWSAKSFSLVRRRVLAVRPPANLQNTRLWHSVYFRNNQRHTYYCTTLIKEGVFTYGRLMNHEQCRLVR